MLRFTRKQFLIAAASSAAMAAIGGCEQLPQESAVGSVNGTGEQVKTCKTVCRYCGMGCGALVEVADGRIVSVQADPENTVNNGVFCVKGYYLADMLKAKNRVTKPLIKKDGQFVEASWDEALDLIANTFTDIKHQYGADALGFYGSGQCSVDESYVYNKLFKGFIGTNNVDGNPRTCMASAVAGFMTTYGKDEPMGTYDDIDKADVFFFIGANPAEAHPVLWVKILERRFDNPNIKIIVADPRETRSTEYADMKLIFKPGMDLALLNSMAYVIVKENLIDKSFIEKHTNFMMGDDAKTWEDYVAFLEDYQPDKVAAIVGVPADQIIEAARLFADPSKETISMWTMGINQRTRGVWANNLIHNLHLITGKLCRPGSSPFSLTGQPSACGSVREVGALSHLLPSGRQIANEKHRQEIADIWGIPVENIQPTPGKAMMKMFQATVDGDIKGLWVMTTNPGHSLPNVNKYREGMKKCFLVVSEGFHPTRTTELADVILPTAVWCEKEGIYGNAERRTQHMEKAIEPPGEAKSDTWALLEIAKRMGYGEHFQYTSLDDIYEEYRRCSIGTGYDLAPLERLRQERGVRWPVVGDGWGEEGSIRYAYPYDPYVGAEEGIKFYGKPDGRAVIYLRPQADPAEVPNADFPFYLTTGRLLEQWHTMTMTGNIDELNQITEVLDGEAGWFVEMHPADAEQLGLNHGSKVKLISPRGQIVSKVNIGGRGKPQQGLLYTNFHDDHVERLANILVSDAVDAASQQPEYKLSICRVEKL